MRLCIGMCCRMPPGITESGDTVIESGSWRDRLMRITGSKESAREGAERVKSQPKVLSAVYISGLMVVSLSGSTTTGCPVSTSIILLCLSFHTLVQPGARVVRLCCFIWSM